MRKYCLPTPEDSEMARKCFNAANKAFCEGDWDSARLGFINACVQDAVFQWNIEELSKHYRHLGEIYKADFLHNLFIQIVNAGYLESQYPTERNKSTNWLVIVIVIILCLIFLKYFV